MNHKNIWATKRSHTTQNQHALIEQADRALANGTPEIAIGIYKKVLVKNPKHFSARSNLGLAYFHLHDFKQAYDIFKALQVETPNDASILNRVGVTSLKLGLIADAEQLSICVMSQVY
jgi:Flp pilus assembly protein TadD